MSYSRRLSRRSFLKSSLLAATGTMVPSALLPGASALPILNQPLMEFGYGEVTLDSELHEKQLRDSHAVLMGLSEDSVLKPFRQMAGQVAPGEDLGGWYHYDPDYDPDTVGTGFAPGAMFGQWVSALARYYAISRSPETREKVIRLNRLYAQTISSEFYGEKNRFPAYCYDKLVCGLLDSQRYVGDPDAFSILERTTDAAMLQLPGKAIANGTPWRKNHQSPGYTWDESYTISENLFLAYQRGAGLRYRELATQYLFDEFYGPLAQGQNVLSGRHAYSHVNSLSSAMQAYLTLGSEKHLNAARNAFDMLMAQSFATGGWGPDEHLRAPGSSDLFDSLTRTHSSFETPCGSYAHFKLTRYLLRVTRDARYGDSMERVMYNTVLGAKPLLADGSNFYYSDFSVHGRKFYHDAHWACCSGTLPQVAADYRINACFRDSEGVYVNLYIPSTLRWEQGGARIALTQTSDYPFDGSIRFDLATPQPSEFAICLRIPAWAEGASVSVNGKRLPETVARGKFLSIRRTWKHGDRIELELPMRLRLEPLDEQHPNVVALVRGPLVLFAISENPPTVTSKQLLSARRVGQQTWQAEIGGNTLKFVPYTAIGEEQYSTYLMTS
jgi:DUF1680 family protein